MKKSSFKEDRTRDNELWWDETEILEAGEAGEIGIWEWDIRGGAIHCSDYVRRLFGITADSPKDTYAPYLNIIYPEDRDLVLQKIEDVRTNGGNYEATHRIITPDGSVKWISARAKVKRDGQGKPQKLLGVVQNVTDRVEAEYTIREQAELFKVFTETTMDGFLQVDMEGNIVETNESYSYMSGYDIDELKTLKIFDLEAREKPDETEAHIKTILKQGSDIFESAHRRKDGRVIDVDISASYWEAGRQILAYVRDVTVKKKEARELHQLQDNLERLVARRTEELKAALMAAKEANNAKNRFLSRISHELRTPLNAIIGFAQLMAGDRQQKLDKDREENIQEILRAGQELLGLIERILEFSSSHTKLFNMNYESTECLPVIRESLELMKKETEERKLKIQIDMNEHTTVLVDRNRFAQVLLSLISNAVKYNSPGGNLTVRVHPSERNGFIRCSVSDTGQGLSRESMKRIFRPFEGINSEYESAAGIGIGLVLAKQMVEEMGGAIGVDSTEGEGSTFWVELPAGGTPSNNGDTKI